MEDSRIQAKKKRLTFIAAVIYIPLFLGVIQFFFDENYKNDPFGWLLLVLFWSLESMDLALRDFWDGDRKSAFFNMLLGITVLVFLIIRSFDLAT